MSINVKEWVSKVETRLYAADIPAKGLAYAWNTKQNMLCFGPGGYGKSLLASMFGEHLKEIEEVTTPIFTMSLSLGTSEDSLLGGVDIKRYKEESELVFNLKRAFVSHEYVVLEEMLDANTETLAVLKDILVSGQVRMGSETEWYPIKTKMVVACTNKTREEVSLDWSTSAILDRFQMECLVQWTTHNYDDYYKALKLSPIGAANSYAAQFVAKCADLFNVNNKDQDPVNPRMAYYAMKCMVDNGLNSDCLNFYPKLVHFVAATATHMVILRKTGILEQMVSYVESYNESIKTFNSVVEEEVIEWVANTVTSVSSLLKNLGKVEWKDENHTLVNDVRDKAREMLKNVMKHAQGLLLSPEEGSTGWLITSFTPSQIHVLSNSQEVGKPFYQLHQGKQSETASQINKACSEL